MGEVQVYAPGRTELAGNHTDHQGGRVIAAAVDCGVRMIAQPNGTTRARVESEGFAPFEIDIVDVEPRTEERFTTAALVRGIVAGLRARDVTVGGFDVRVTSTVPAGGGLSSSAAFELALARALVGLFAPEGEQPARCGSATAGEGDLSPLALARIGQAAERDYFGKACGLMDQLAVALGGVVAIDFADDEPRVERVDFDFAQQGYALCLVDTHCDHSRYTEEYSQVPRDMNAVAELLGAPVLSRISEKTFLSSFDDVRAKLGDVPALRALHYYHENRLVDARTAALRAGDVDGFLRFTRLSGASSAQYLQNVSTYDRREQPAMVALALADLFLQGEGACRIHGGGFGGTVQAFVPIGRIDAFTRMMDDHLGPGSCHAYRVDAQGVRVLDRCR